MKLLLSSSKAELTQVGAGRGYNQECVPLGQPAESPTAHTPTAALQEQSQSESSGWQQGDKLHALCQCWPV